MSGLLPANTSLQLSTPAGDITHQGVLGSNASGTTLLPSTFPTTSTSTSLGHYHYTEPTTNSLKFLNASGAGQGGHQFWHSSSTESPIKVLETNRTATTINTSLKNTSSNVVLNMVSNDLTLTNDLSQSFSNHEAFKLIYNGAVNTQITNSPENPNLVFTSNITNSQLSASDLTFGGVSLPARVTTAEADIDILEVKQTQVLQVYASPAIFADARPATTVPTASSNTYGQFGWYFKNSFTSGSNKVGWYLPPAIGMRVQDVLGLYLRFFNCSTTSNDNTPFITVYTVPTGTNDVIPGFIHSSMTYIFDQSVTPTINTSYTMFENVTGTCPNPNSYASNLVGMEQSTVNNPRGEYLPTEVILAFNIGTSSSSPVNSVEFIAQKFGIMTATGTTELLFQTLL